MKKIINEALLPGGAGLKLIEKEPAELKSGEIRVRVRVASLTPADHLLIEGNYFFRREAPFVPGLLGVGEVIEHNDGVYGRYLMGKRVFFSSGYERDGAWSELAVADAKTVVPLSNLDDETAVSLGNALTAVGLVETARKLGARAVIANAAAGNLGGLIASRAAQLGMGFIGVVRKDARVTELKAAGVENVLNQTSDDFSEALGALAERLKATVLIDSLGGGATVPTMEAMPRGSTAFVIGRLARQPLSFEALPLLLGRDLTLRAFGVNDWIDSKSIFGVLSAARHAQNLLRSHNRLPVLRRISLEELIADFELFTKETSGGRTLVYPGEMPDTNAG